ncbi:hypothetical protein [Sphingomicrobium sediminis]|uniref:Nickel/cobalt transporter regulator n=1 Tax=Sphingomicrobium sediminis TaxID=2950949 RepID=A0A9X2J2U7_9SPHN|nr:hypothetical protein [Sphingomicrobium sediminis]MCM8558144.1 hypothetical protein [Sphingomicrobium sediminis]
MRNMILAAGVASLALAVPAIASGSADSEENISQDRGNGNGNGNGNRGNGNGRGNGNAQGNQDRGNDLREDRRDRAEDRREARRERVEDRREDIRDRREDARDRARDRYEDRRDRYDDGFDARRVVYEADRYRYDGRDRRGYVDGCPPGLAKKNNGCLPPGQAKQIYGQRVPASYADRRLVGPYADWYGRDNDWEYRLGREFIYRIGGDDLVSGLIPLYDRRGYYYPVGSRYPDAYDSYNLPYQYRSYYRDDYYRYGDGAIYRVDPETQLIQSVAALLTGDVAVGQPLPASYRTYNVPYSYRDRYYDQPDGYYRYSDGYIYRVDPETMLVAEIVDAVL